MNKTKFDAIETKIKLLKAAKKRIRGITATEGWINETAICRNIEAVSGWWEMDCADEITNYISRSLGRYMYLKDWIEARRPKFVITAQSLKKARIQYIDWMIAEYQKQLAEKV